jgi:hypothetical protein
MPSSPFNFATLAASGQYKILGTHLGTPVPAAYGGPGDGTFMSYMYGNWATVYPAWIKPQMIQAKRRDDILVRLGGMAEKILDGTYTQAYYEACVAQLLSDARGLGLYVSFCGSFWLPSWYANFGSYTDAQWFAPTQSMLTNVLIPNQDVVAYLEAGMGESNAGGGAGSIATTNAIAAMAKAMTTIPISISSNNGSFTGFDASKVDLWGLHYYPEDGQHGDPATAAAWQATWNFLFAALQTAGGKPVLLEEFGLGNNPPGTATIAKKADFLNVALETMFGHPSVVGAMVWTQFGPQFNGDFSILGEPSTTSTLSTYGNGDWTDTAASIAYSSWGPLNRSLKFTLSLNGSQAINGTDNWLSVDTTSRSVAAPSVVGAGFETVIQTAGVVPTSFVGTFSLTGDAGSQYTIRFVVKDETANTFYTMGSAIVITGSTTNHVINASGVVPVASNCSFGFRVQRTSGTVDGTMTAVSGVMTIGSAPAPPVPAARGRRAEIYSPKRLAMIGGAAYLADAIRRNPVVTRRRLLGR